MTDLVCPAAVPIASGPHGRPAAVCGIIDRDQERADRILEGAPIGVVVSSADDPPTFFGFCAGGDPPPQDAGAAYDRAKAGEVRLPQTYACCPVYAAAQEWDLLSRLYALRPSGADLDLPELTLAAEEPAEAEIRRFLGGP